MKNIKIKKIMLENASKIHHYQNIVESSFEYELYMLDNCYYLETWEDNENNRYQPQHYIFNIDKKIFMFLVKGRKLRSGLSSPMARYYGYKSINKEVLS